MERIEIIGDNYSGHWGHTRIGCRGIVLRENELLLTHQANNGQYMIPGGGLEGGESEAECCAREVAEETGVVVDPGECALEINEYYEDWKYVSFFFLCRPVGICERRPTEWERKWGMEPRWVPVDSAIREFSRHREYAATDEERRGIYLREYTALNALLK